MRNLFKHNETYLMLIILIFSIGLTLINPVFMTWENMFDLLKSSAGTAILAVGVFLVLLSGGIDVSCTAIAIVGQYISINVLIATGIDSVALAFLISILIGVSLGAINAVFISIFNIPTLITTLGTSSLFHGLLLEFVGTRAVNAGDLPDKIKTFGKINILTITRADGSTYGLSVFFLILIAIVALTWFILKYTMIGRGIYAIGGNREAAQRTGYNIRKIQFFIYCYAGFLAGVMGVLHLTLIRYSNPNYLVGTELNIIAAVVLGGTRISGGSGTLTGTLMGVALITILEKNLILIGLSSYWQKFFIGLIIVLGVTITYIQNKISTRKNLSLRGA
ncbi:MAG: simple sugar transport system permease protein [Verrucomicrobiota bacterium]|nr:simple sugar transport system permease protein [Verrucomicrobiota bacterium]